MKPGSHEKTEMICCGSCVILDVFERSAIREGKTIMCVFNDKMRINTGELCSL